MCGIAGFCDFTKKANKQTLVKMTDVLNHRGPDDSGYSFYENEYATIGLGHRRLSILDLSNHGHQPMSYEHLEVVYNGEVYNFKEIRAELEKFNYTFESDSDTEVILKAYHKWGIKAVDKFIGMFAITFYDKSQEKLILIRDRAGVKPLNYYFKDGLFLFSSELKSFHENSGFEKNINKDALALYLKYGYILEPYSIFEHTHKLQAGHYLELNIQNSKLSIHKYWDVVDSYNKPKLDISENEAIVETEKLLKSACEYRMVSDVPVGMFLSGGYDSSVVTALLQHERKEKLKTFTIGFKEKGFDEAPYAKQIAKHLGTNHTEFYCTAKDALEIIPKLCEIYDEPFGDSSAIPTTLVSQIAKKQVSVSLSADGGDEIFGGYGKYTGITKKLDTFAKIPNIVKPILAKALKQNIVHKSAEKFAGMFEAKTRCERFADILSHDEKQMLKETGQFTKKQLAEVLNYKHKELFTNFDTNIQSDRLSNLLAIDYKTYMVDDILHKVDRATMSVSLEGREPLLDHRIIEFVAQLPSDMKIKNGDKKWLLKQITHKYLPKEMMDRPKQGFGVPIQEWFKDELKEYFEKYLSKKALSQHDLFNIDEILKIKKQYLAGENVGVAKLWYVLIFQMWYEKWM
jgi:asparagine synthase (glutamine-hydrolysing)